MLTRNAAGPGEDMSSVVLDGEAHDAFLYVLSSVSTLAFSAPFLIPHSMPLFTPRQHSSVD